jgi:hypothetical protein
MGLRKLSPFFLLINSEHTEDLLSFEDALNYQGAFPLDTNPSDLEAQILARRFPPTLEDAVQLAKLKNISCVENFWKLFDGLRKTWYDSHTFEGHSE